MRKTLLSVLAALLLVAPVFASGNRNAAAPTAGVVYRTLYASEVETLNYLWSSNANDWRIPANVVDALVEYDRYGVLKPALATSWEHSADYTVWTFKIRQGVKWVDHTGKAVADVTAHDWVSSVQWVANANNRSNTEYVYNGYIKNAEAYFAQTADSSASQTLKPEDLGVKALDNYTLQFTLENPCVYFVSTLSFACYLPAYGPFLAQKGAGFGRDHESLLYCGAYYLANFKPQQERIMVKNPLYWDLANVFIDRVEYTFNAQASTIAPTLFQRGEIDNASINSDILSQWLSNPATKDLVRNNQPDRSYTYWYIFNFEPRFDAAYEPDNWLIAVNNENFRQSLFWGLDRLKALAVIDPEDPSTLLSNTVTPTEFAVGAGKDFTQYEAIKPISDRDSFDAAKALEYKAKALSELQAAGATLPIKILMPYNPVVTNWDKECQVVEQQLEALLGTDYIDIIIEAGPSSGFLNAVRRSGKYALYKGNWGADYADPETWAEPFREVNNTYNFIAQQPNQAVDGKPAVNKTSQTQAIVAEYYRLVNAAKSYTVDVEQRYAAFAEAEAYFINHAFIIPFSLDTNGYVASRLNPFEAQFSVFGLALYRFKGQHLLDKPMSNAEFRLAYEKWRKERADALAASR
jgi:oligopeptide transport system substrate-binding protein